MTRTEFFRAIYTRSLRIYKFAIALSTIIIVLLRIWNTESALTLAIVPLALCAPVFFIMPFTMRERMFDLWDKNTHKQERSFFITIELAPYAAFITLITILPPYLITAFILGVESGAPQHTEALTILCFLFLLNAHFYWMADSTPKCIAVKL